MSMGRFIILILLTAIVFYAVTQLPQHGTPIPATPSEAFFPALGKDIDKVQSITVQTGTQHFHIVRHTATDWRLEEKANYPAAKQKVADALLMLAELRPLEAKTSNPALHTQLDLQEGKAIRLSLEDGQQHTLAALLIGKTSAAKGNTGQFETYVRKPEEAQSWLALSTLRVEADPLAWVERNVLALDRQRVRQVTLHVADGSTLTVQRDKPEEKDYTLNPMPTGATLKSAGALSLLVFQAANLTLEDIQELPGTFQATERFVLETFDGLQVAAELAPEGEHFLIRLSAKAVEPQLTEIKPPFLAPTELTQTVAELNTRWGNWVYHITPMVHNGIFKPVTELVTLAAAQPAVVPTVAPEAAAVAPEAIEAAPATIPLSGVESATSTAPAATREPEASPVAPGEQSFPGQEAPPPATDPAAHPAGAAETATTDHGSAAILEAAPQTVPLVLTPFSTITPSP